MGEFSSSLGAGTVPEHPPAASFLPPASSFLRRQESRGAGQWGALALNPPR